MHARLDRRCDSTPAPSSRSLRLDDDALRAAAAQRQRRRAAAQRAVAGRVRARHRRRSLSRPGASAATASTAPTRPATSPSYNGQARLRGRATARLPVSGRPARPVLARRRRRAAVQRWQRRCATPSRPGTSERDRAERPRRRDPLRLARDDRRRRPRSLRPLGADARLRRALDAARALPAGWAPYSTGHWAWVRPWGWTWVDDAPWGFAPFHYGRWVYHRNTWCWAPGTLRRAAGLCAGAGGVGRRPARRRLDHGRRRRRRSAGSRSRRARSTCRAIAPARATCARSTSPTSPTSPTITTIVNNRHGEADRRDFANRQLPARGDRRAGRA